MFSYLEGEYGGGGWPCRVLTGKPGMTMGSPPPPPAAPAAVDTTPPPQAEESAAAAITPPPTVSDSSLRLKRKKKGFEARFRIVASFCVLLFSLLLCRLCLHGDRPAVNVYIQEGISIFTLWLAVVRSVGWELARQLSFTPFCFSPCCSYFFSSRGIKRKQNIPPCLVLPSNIVKRSFRKEQMNRALYISRRKH